MKLPKMSSVRFLSRIMIGVPVKPMRAQLEPVMDFAPRH
jgi:hypothetical protein